MSPLTSIHSLSHAYNIPAQPGLERPGAARLGGIESPSASRANGAAPVGTDFSNLLDKMVQEVNSKQTAASDAVSALQSGQAVSLHQAMIAMEEANVSFQLMVEVRNKLLESYQELMRLQV